jgi:protein-arginine kinase activator protein McsA
MSLCERCKGASATLHITRVEASGEAAQRHLCESCAIEEGLAHVVAQARRSRSRIIWIGSVLLLAVAALVIYLAI